MENNSNVAKTLILGIDPGFTGALAVISATGPDRGELVEVIDMPLLKPKVFEKRPRPEIDACRVAEWVARYAHRIQLCTIEKVSAAPGQGVVSMFRFGEGFGLVRGVCVANGLRMLLPGPVVWKTAMNLSRNKAQSLRAAAEMVSGSQDFVKRMKDHGRAEAMLLALFGARSLAKQSPPAQQFPRGGDINDLF